MVLLFLHLRGRLWGSIALIAVWGLTAIFVPTLGYENPAIGYVGAGCLGFFIATVVLTLDEIKRDRQ